MLQCSLGVEILLFLVKVSCVGAGFLWKLCKFFINLDICEEFVRWFMLFMVFFHFYVCFCGTSWVMLLFRF